MTRSGVNENGREEKRPPSLLLPCGDSERARDRILVSSRLVVARVWKNVKSATSFPPIWTFIDCGRDREGGEGEGGKDGRREEGRARAEIPSISKMILEPSRAPPPTPLFILPLDRAYVIVVREEAGPRAIEKIKIQPRGEISYSWTPVNRWHCARAQCEGVNTFRRHEKTLAENSPRIVALQGYYSEREKIHIDPHFSGKKSNNSRIPRHVYLTTRSMRRCETRALMNIPREFFVPIFYTRKRNSISDLLDLGKKSSSIPVPLLSREELNQT